jgi:hypothetical protein
LTPKPALCHHSPAFAQGVGFELMVVRGQMLALMWAGSFLLGCSPQCQKLCTDWFDYRSNVCNEFNLEDDRVTCIADYRRRSVSDDELTQCEQQRVEVRALLAAKDDRCCGEDAGQPPECSGAVIGDDDDSAR